MQVPADVRTVSNMHTGRVCRGALGCEMILLSCGLTGIYFPINLLLLVCLMDYVCVCVEVSIKKTKKQGDSFNAFLCGLHFTVVF